MCARCDERAEHRACHIFFRCVSSSSNFTRKVNLKFKLLLLCERCDLFVPFYCFLVSEQSFFFAILLWVVFFSVLVLNTVSDPTFHLVFFFGYSFFSLSVYLTEHSSSRQNVYKNLYFMNELLVCVTSCRTALIRIHSLHFIFTFSDLTLSHNTNVFLLCISRWASSLAFN